MKLKNPNDRLQYARREHGWTQARLAEELGVAESTVRSWESGLHAPSLAYRSQLCTLFQMTQEELGFALSKKDQSLALPPMGQNAVFVSPVRLDEKNTIVERYEEGGSGQGEKNRSQEDFFGLVPVAQSLRRSIMFPEHRGNENRHRMLKRVQSRWISGFLDHLSHVPLIELNLHLRPEAVASPWRAKNQEPYGPALHMLTSTLIETYNEADGELLILGEPGAGKTTLLLKLTRELVERCRIDETFPIPVIFNLSAWAVKRAPLAEWLMEELHLTYQVPFKVAQQWIINDQVFPLLDGLDEVDLSARPACVEAINKCRREHGFIPIVVCCRTSDYEALPERLVLNTAVEVQPLTFQQIDDYISQRGKDLEMMRVALERDPGLQEIVSTPLMLRILAYSAQGMSLEEVYTLNSSLVLEQYVERLLHKNGEQNYPIEQTKQWISWLARQMQKHNQTEFYVERMQPDWLEGRFNHYRSTIIRIVYGFEMLVHAGLYACFRSDSVPTQPGLFYWLGGKGLGNTILGWMAPGLGESLHGGTSLGLIVFFVSVIVGLIVLGRGRGFRTISRSIVRRGLLEGARYGLIAGSLLGLFAGILYGVSGGLSMGIYRGSGTGLSEGLLVSVTIALAVVLRPQTHSGSLEKYSLGFTEHLKNYLTYIVCGAVGMIGVYSLESHGISLMIVILGLLMGVGGGFVFGVGNVTEVLYPNIGRKIEPAETVTWSWETVGRDLIANITEGLFLTLLIAIPLILVLGCASAIFYGLAYGLRYGLVYGSIVGIVNGVAAILVGILNSGWSSSLLGDKHRLNTPNAGIHNSWRHAFFAGTLFGVIGGIVGGVTSGVAFWIGGVPGWFTLLLGFTLVISSIFAFWFWMIYGGVAVIEHYVLRWYLYRAGSLPWKYVQFLDHVADQGMLRKVGGGYIFTHRLLLEHFAHMDISKILQKENA